MTTPKRAPQVVHGDCLDIMKMLPDNSVDSIVTDPPYGLGFMGKAWDALPPGREWAEECLRVLKPGGHLLAFGGSRTWHRLAVALEAAGFEIRDSIAWLYGSGFPKSLDVSKAIDKAAGAEREVTGRVVTPFKVDAAATRGTSLQGSVNGDFSKQTDEGGYRYTEMTAPATPAAEAWQGWGTALKPAFEPVVMARKPLAGKTVAANVQAHGTGALNIDGCRLGNAGYTTGGQNRSVAFGNDGLSEKQPRNDGSAGRWPANVALDEHTAAILDQQSGVLKGGQVGRNKHSSGTNGIYGKFVRTDKSFGGDYMPDEGGASRFFKVAESDEQGAISPHFPREFDAPFMYVAKAPKKERPVVDGVAHATVKPLALMRWLVRLVTPPGGTVLEPFAGSGTTVEACILEGFHCIAIEREAEYLPLIQARIDRQDAA